MDYHKITLASNYCTELHSLLQQINLCSHRPLGIFWKRALEPTFSHTVNKILASKLKCKQSFHKSYCWSKLIAIVQNQHQASIFSIGYSLDYSSSEEFFAADYFCRFFFWSRLFQNLILLTVSCLNRDHLRSL